MHRHPSDFPDPASIILVLVCSATVPLAIRLLPRNRVGRPRDPQPANPRVVSAVLLQDLWMASLLTGVAALAGAGLSRPLPAALATATCLFFAHAVIVLDCFIRRETGLRFSWHFLSYLRVVSVFAGSVQRGGVRWAGLGALAVLHVSLLTAVLAGAFSRWGVPRVDLPALGWMAALGGVVWVAQRRADPAILWAHQGIWTHFLRGWLHRPARTRAAGHPPPAGFLRTLTPAEDYALLDPTRPLLRLTRGYRGPRRFDLDLRGERPHVILLFLESFCASCTGTLGRETGASPEFDRLAREGVLFRNFYANGVQTARAVIAGLFGIPPRFSERPVQADPRGAPRLVGLADLFLQLEYHTAYLHNGALAFEQADVFFPRHGYREMVGMDDLRRLFPKAPVVGGWGLPDECLMRHCADWVAAQEARGQPGFATVFTMTNHHPFEVPPGFATPEFRCPGNPEKEEFLRTFHYSDACLGLLVRLLRERGLDRKCLLVILADTAQPLGEHDSWGVQSGLYEENLRVPLLFHAPGHLRQPAVIDEPASQVDLLPTFIDLFGHPFAHHSIGTSLLRPAGTRPIWFNTPFGPGAIGQRLGPRKLIHEPNTGLTRLFDLSLDPEERNDLGRLPHPDVAAWRTELLSAHDFVQDLYRTNRFC